MKLNLILEEKPEYIPLNKENASAREIGYHIARVALTKTGGKNPGHAKKMAIELSNRYHSDILAAIDDELGFTQTANVNIRA